MKNVVIVGGGTGLSVMLRGMKSIPDIGLDAIVTVADDGGSTGRLRDSYQIPAMGDIRNVMCAMAEEESIFTELMNYRFKGGGDIGGHNLGNLTLALGDDRQLHGGDPHLFPRPEGPRQDPAPSTLEVVTLYAVMEDGTIVRGEKNIPKFRNHIDRVFYQRHIRATQEALQAIRDADLIIYGIGSLYTSIMPNLIIDEIRKQAHAGDPCRKVYFCNAMSQPGETDEYSVEDHVDAICRHAFADAVDIVVKQNNTFSTETLDRYRAEGSAPVELKEERHRYLVLERDLMQEGSLLIRHDPQKVRAVVEEILRMQ